jgi:hypothetical protein
VGRFGRITHMRSLTLVLAVSALVALLPASASAAGCAPITCAGSGTPIAGTNLVAVRPTGMAGPVRMLDLVNGTLGAPLPHGLLFGHMLLHLAGHQLAWTDVTTGATTRTLATPGTARWTLAGASTDARRAVLVRGNERRTFVAVTGEAPFSLSGSWEFDALAGSRLYLLQIRHDGYAVRLFDLASRRLVKRPLKDPGESALIKGIAWSRVATPDGRRLLTLYADPDGGAMVHELDLVRGTARCIDLPGTGDFNSGAGYGIVASADGSTLWAVSPGYGRAVAIDVAQEKVVRRIAFPAWLARAPEAPAVALAPDGKRLAFALNGRTALLDLETGRLRQGPAHMAVALGFSPDGTHLWAVSAKARSAELALPQG